MMDLRDELEKRFYRYTAVSSQSDEEAGVLPSSEGQRELAGLLFSELSELGLRELSLSPEGVLIGHLPSNLPDGKGAVIGWVAHLDTVDVHLSPEIHPRTIRNYPGGDICQNPEKGIYLREDSHPELRRYIGDDIIVSDGTSVLGADNKAAIANIMTALAFLKDDPSLLHGTIYVAFVPDEEIGLLGAKAMDLSLFPVDYAYTIDCCSLGELVYETFHAGSARLHIRGVTAHPMSSKDHLVNPALIAADFAELLPRAETPECTEKKEGFFWVTGIRANALTADVTILIRDHDKERYGLRKKRLQEACEMIRLRNPKAEISLEISDTYGNIADALTETNRGCIDRLFAAMKELDIAPQVIAMRGGTDGSYLSMKGILTPNYFTGAHNFHGADEFLPLGAMERSCMLTLKLMEEAEGA